MQKILTVGLFTTAGLAILIGLSALAAAKCQKCLCTFFYNLARLHTGDVGAGDHGGNRAVAQPDPRGQRTRRAAGAGQCAAVGKVRPQLAAREIHGRRSSRTLLRRDGARQGNRNPSHGARRAARGKCRQSEA